MRALVTGAGGFIGGHVVRTLVAAGAEVRALYRNPASVIDLPREVDFVRGDIRDFDSMRHAVEGCDTVFHLAALYSYARGDAMMMESVNVEGTRTVLDAALRGRRRRIIHTSSCATCGPVRGRPATEADLPSPADLAVPYKRTKLDAEQVALRAARDGGEVVVVNPTVPVGRGDRRPTPTGKMVADVVHRRARAYLAGSALNIVAVEDVALGHLKALERGRTGQRYLLGGENMAVSEVFSVIARAVGHAPPRVGLPWSAVYPMTWIVDAVLRAVGREPQLLVLDEVQTGRVPHLFDDSKARTELGYVSSPAAQALAAGARDALARRPPASRRSRSNFAFRPPAVQ